MLGTTIIHRTDYISFWSFEISEGIENSESHYPSKFIFLPTLNKFGPIWIILVFVLTTLLKVAKIQ